MAVKIRLMRIGTNRRPFYRVVAVDERKKRTGGYLELLGTYNPLTEPKEINLQQDKIDAWIKKGAVPSYGFLRIIGKAPQRKARKAKKAPKTEAPAAASEKAPAEPAPETEAVNETSLEAAAENTKPQTEEVKAEESTESKAEENAPEPETTEEKPEEEVKV